MIAEKQPKPVKRSADESSANWFVRRESLVAFLLGAVAMIYVLLGNPKGKPVFALHGGPGVGSYSRLGPPYVPNVAVPGKWLPPDR